MPDKQLKPKRMRLGQNKDETESSVDGIEKIGEKANCLQVPLSNHFCGIILTHYSDCSGLIFIFL